MAQNRVVDSRKLICVLVGLLPLACSAEVEKPRETAPSRIPRLTSAGEPNAGWLGAVENRLGASEREIRQVGDGFKVTSRRGDLRAEWDGTGRVSVVQRGGSRTGSRVDPSNATLGLEVTGWGRGEWPRVSAPTWVGLGACQSDGAMGSDGKCLRRLEMRRGELHEWWESTEKGLHHGFDLQAPPPSDTGTFASTARSDQTDHWVRIEVLVTGAWVETAAGGATFVQPGGQRWRYQGLRAWDANGRELVAWIESSQGSLTVSVDDAGAQYPIAVDPVLAAAVWTAESNQAGARLGYSVASAGDVNGDGFGDVIVGAYEYSNGESGEGRAYVYLGSASGLSTTPAWIAESDQIDASFGQSVASAGDVNGDGFGDVIVGAPSYSNGEVAEGRAYVYLGSAGGLSTTAAWTAESDQANALFGFSVASAGDVNGDGFGDVVVGAYDYANGQANEGRAYVYLGSAGGLSTTAAWTAESDQAVAWFGYSVAGAGDVNGDGFGDVIVGAMAYDNGQSNEGRAYVYLGSASGLSSTPAWTAESDQAGAAFGVSVASAGDVNGDGFGDVIVGAGYYTNGQASEGRVFVYLGSAGGLSVTPGWTAESNQANAYLGEAVASAGDVNGDGFGDVIVGSYCYDNGQTDEGRAYVYLGSASGLSTTPIWTAESDQATAYFGFSVASAGDVNGDGLGDIIVGAYMYDNGQADEGRAYVYLGAASALSMTASWTAESNQANAEYGLSVASAGDVNGDGFGDVIVGADYYDNGQADEGRAYVYLGSASGLSTTAAWTAESDQADAYFGHSVASAGDVNGDGYGDVIVGAYDYTNGENGEGRAFVYLGSASGLSATPAWATESDQDSAFFGCSVASAGDVNGDGFGDVIVGAYGYSNGQNDEGRAYVYLGSASGLSTSAAWTAESDQASVYFGGSVASAGDVNGDGFGDVIVGADFYGNGQADEGRAYVYLGSASGLSSTPAWTAESDQTSAYFGTSVASAGDVNGDGFGDIVVGASSYDNGQSDEGRAYVYLGSASGLSTTAAWTAESDQNFAYFGVSVASAGDVNGDGFGDVIIGAAGYDTGVGNEGRAYVYLGSASGLSTSAVWTAESIQAGASFGQPVASAGDVNGDGFGDVVVGAHFDDNGQTDEGRAYLYLGNGGDSTGSAFALMPQARQSGTSTPIQPWGKSTANGFDLRIRGRTAMGRTRVKVQIEVKPLGVSFNSAGFTTSGSWTDIGTAGLSLTQAVGGLQANRPYHWRARLLYEPARGHPQLWSHWVWGGLSGDPLGVHLRTTGTCTPTGFPDTNCDNIDDDCNGQADEGYVPITTNCGVGACARTGTSSCVGGVVQQNCTQGTPAANDATCDNIDDDCDGSKDEHYVPVGTNCGVGACARTGTTSCVLGVVQDSCVPGTSAISDATCDGADDDCSGQSDEDYVIIPACGVGYCRATSTPSACNAGVETPCVPGQPLSADDRTCDGIDDNCNGFIDEDVTLASSCPPPNSVCESVVCGPQSGACENSRISECCTSSTECSTASACIAGQCNTGHCSYTMPMACCTSDADCDDGNACTQTACEISSGQCSREWESRCCLSNADCDDGDDCSYDECTTAHRCQFRPATCSTQGPCGADVDCVFSFVIATLGSESPRQALVDGAGPSPVIQLALTNDAVAGELSRLSLAVVGLTRRSAYFDPDFLLYVDADGDGRVDQGSRPVAEVTAFNPERQQRVTFEIQGAPLLPAATTRLLVVMRLSPKVSGITAQAGIGMLPFLLVFLVASLLGPLQRRSRRRFGLVVVTAIGLVWACGRTGFDVGDEELTMVLPSNEDLGVTSAAQEQLWVRGAPIEGYPFVVRW